MGMAVTKAEAPFVFEGSVKSTSASNVAAVPADDKTAIVQVDHVRQAPRALAGLAGKEITVRLGSNEAFSKGEKAVFFADGLVFGHHLAVQSLGHDPLVPVEARAAVAAADPVVQRLRNRIDQAHTVVTGRVSALRPPALPKSSARGISGGRISEHAPLWQDAVVDVSGVLKGPKQKKVVVRFPSSTDVRWRNAPHFKKGQQGTWLLQPAAPPPVAGKAARALAVSPTAPAPSGYYTALDPNDFHPAAQAAVVHAMLPAAPSPKGIGARKLAKRRVAKKAGKKAARKPARASRGKRRS
jgi:hypothetical protein